jgi:hypothetical protein
MRRFIRHTTDCPVDVHLSMVVPPGREYLRNISRGGLCFRSTVALAAGATIHITIPVAEPVFETDGFVAWCEQTADCFEVGVRFAGQDPREDLIVEQVCQIEDFKREVWMQDGRLFNGAEAALEWLRRQRVQTGLANS